MAWLKFSLLYSCSCVHFEDSIYRLKPGIKQEGLRVESQTRTKLGEVGHLHTLKLRSMNSSLTEFKEEIH